MLDCGGKRYVHLSVNNGDFLKLAKLEYEDGQLIDEKDESTVPDEAQQRVLEWLQACKPHVETHIGIGSANVSAGRFRMGYQLHICIHTHTHACSARACPPPQRNTCAHTHTQHVRAQAAKPDTGSTNEANLTSQQTACVQRDSWLDCVCARAPRRTRGTAVSDVCLCGLCRSFACDSSLRRLGNPRASLVYLSWTRVR